ncbi:MAG TPA: RDD family protein [Gammaproteobacteria bacterium]|nr:RDD family protein [Gammaproteobacteria bacterium]
MTQHPAPGIPRLLAAMLYDLILLIGILLLATTLVVIPLNISYASTTLDGNPLFQLYLVAVIILFYTWFWSHGGQTLGMRTWKIRVVSRSGEPLSLLQAFKRLLLAVITLAPAGLGLWWKIIDRESQTLYDRLAGSRLIRL